jgi:peptide-methionine (S)-S-oxide reductase
MRSWAKRLGLLAMLAAAAIGAAPAAFAADGAVVIPAPVMDSPKAAGPPQTAVLAGGCFWGVQGVYQRVRGVRKAVSGYAGGAKETAQYERVSGGSTGHAESVEISFDPKEISFGEILQIFFSVVHDPTQLNRQGPDVGTQYRSAVFALDESQRSIARAYIAQLDKAKAFGRPIVTTVDPLKGFYAAEGYHQDFLVNNPHYPYIVVHDLPKLEALKKVFPARYRDQPVTVKSAN